MTSKGVPGMGFVKVGEIVLFVVLVFALIGAVAAAISGDYVLLWAALPGAGLVLLAIGFARAALYLLTDLAARVVVIESEMGPE